MGGAKSFCSSQDGLLSRRHSQCLPQHSQQAEEGLLIHENYPEKENTKLSRSVWFLFKQLQLALVMLPTGVYKGCGPAVSSTLMWGVQTCKPEQVVPGAVVANGKGDL